MAWAKRAVEQKQTGPTALRDGLIQKGIDQEIIEEVLKRVLGGGEEYWAREAAKKWSARRKDLRSAGFEGRLAGYLERKGFTPEAIEKVIKK
jgi:SOS response regulatory protein OraA/RecX